MKPSPAPRTLNTSTVNDSPLTPSSRLAGIGPSNAVAPAAPRLQTNAASDTLRTLARASMVSDAPPATWNSSSVPTMTSNRDRVLCSLDVTAADSMKRFSPSPCPERPHRFGR